MENSCIIFDFDCTITSRHLYYFLNDSAKFIEIYKGIDSEKLHITASYINSLQWQNGIALDYATLANTVLDIDKNDAEYFCEIIFGGDERLELLKNFFKTCQEKNIEMHISSRGNLRNIILALKISGLLKYFNSIHCTIDKKIYYRDGKTENFNFSKDTLIFEMLKNSYDILFYIDDTNTEHERLKKYLDILDENPEYDFYAYRAQDKYKYYLFINGIVQNTGGGIAEKQIEIFLRIFSDITRAREHKKLTNNQIM